MTQLDIDVFNQTRPVIKPTMTAVEDRALEEAESLYSPSGILRLFTTYFRGGAGALNHVGHGQYFDFDHVVSRLLDIPGLATTFGSQVYGGGKGLDIHDMYVSSMGEGIERLLGSFAVFDWHERMELGSYRQLERKGLKCLHPDELPTFSEQQLANPHFEFRRWDEDDILGWLPGTRHFSGETVYVPAQLVLFIYYRADQEPRIGLAPSGGLASHITGRKAKFHAICEVLERDAINLRWHNKIPLDKIEFDVPMRDRQVQRSLDGLGEQLNVPDFYLHNLDFHELPVVTIISFDDWLEELSYNAGGGVGASIDDAVRSAIGEYAQSERSLRICQLTRNWQFNESFDSLFGIAEDATPSKFSRYIQAIAFYGYESNRAKTDWYFHGGSTVPLSEIYARHDEGPADPFDRLEAALRTRDIDPIMFEFTLPGFKQLELWKCYIPEVTLPYPPSSPALGHPRFVEIAQRHGAPIESNADLLYEPVPYP